MIKVHTVRTHRHTRARAHTHAHTHTHTHTHAHAHTHTCVCHVRTYIRTYVFLSKLSYKFTTCIRRYVRTYVGLASTHAYWICEASPVITACICSIGPHVQISLGVFPESPYVLVHHVCTYKCFQLRTYCCHYYIILPFP